jgi:dihydroorotate dehydrogenase (NAD+) catalytic subunit
MINAVGLANPGVETVRDEELPWLAAKLHHARVIVNVVGDAVEDFAKVVAELNDVDGVSAFELNVSCPNVKAGGNGIRRRQRDTRAPREARASGDAPAYHREALTHASRHC